MEEKTVKVGLHGGENCQGRPTTGYGEVGESRVREDQGSRGRPPVQLRSKIGEVPHIINHVNPISDKDCVWKVCKKKEGLRKMCEDRGSNMSPPVC